MLFERKETQRAKTMTKCHHHSCAVVAAVQASTCDECPDCGEWFTCRSDEDFDAEYLYIARKTKSENSLEDEERQ
jgi:hypothetical protein